MQLQFKTGITLPIGGMTSNGFSEMGPLEKFWDCSSTADPGLPGGHSLPLPASPASSRALTLDVLHSVQLQFKTGITLPIGGMTSNGFSEMGPLEKFWD
ncbi:hypothetical protein CTI14_60780, partial [Methylobacterium radiotolerans]